jgi:archaellum component FlaG (FlaF/FlaG flagellin family)
MVSAVFTESILLIASLTLAGIFASMIIGKSSTIQSLFSTQTHIQRDIMLTSIKIVYVNAGNDTIRVYVKNIGVNTIADLDAVDVYFGELASLSMIPYNSSNTPRWIYTDNSIWDPKETKELVITLNSSLQTGKTYMVKIVLHNGVTDEYIFSY